MRAGDVDEPLLAVGSRPKPFFLRRRFLRAFTPAGVLAVIGLIALLVSGNLLLPFERLVTLEGAMGSKADFFDDEQVNEILLRHHLRVHVTRIGSRDATNIKLDRYDVVFPSGKPAVELVIKQMRAAGKFNIRYPPFVSPIVLATYREYAETLRRNGVATLQPAQGGDPLYYNLNLAKFLDLVRQRTTWNQLGIRGSGSSNGNQVIAQTSSVCGSNSGGSYLGMVAFTILGRVVTTDQEAMDLAIKIKPLLADQGLPASAPMENYLVPEGRMIAPIVVVYEHQYLTHQLQFTERSGRPDHDRVLLYPSTVFETAPELIALNEYGARLGLLLTTDPQLRRRALELGLRVLDPTGVSSSEQLTKFLTEQGVPVPATPADNTAAVLPEVPLLEKMISVVGDCPPVR